jgi:hypothetical protein
MTKELEAAGLKREAQYVKEVGMPSPAQLDSLLADKSSGPLLRRVLRKIGVRWPR